MRPRLAWRTTLDEPVVAVAAAQDTLAVAGSEGAVQLLAANGDPIARADLGDAVQCLAVAPDGKRIAAAGGASRAIWSADGHQVHRADAGWCTALAWHTDGVAVVDGRRVVVLDPDGEVRFTSPALASTPAGLSWLRDGRRFAVGAYGAIHVFEPATGRAVHQFAGAGALTCLAAQPQGRWVVGGDHDLTVHGWRLPTGEDVRMRGFPAKINLVAFDGTGRWLATPSAEDVPVWDFSSPGPSGRPPVEVGGHSAQVAAVAWRPGADAVLLTGDTAGALALCQLTGRKPGGRAHPLWTDRFDDPVTSLAFSDAATFLVGHRSGAVSCYRSDPA